MKIYFVWGPGGVGKTHLAIYAGTRPEDSNQARALMTLDPSNRAFELPGVPPYLTLKKIDANSLFEDLAKKMPTNAKVQAFYQKMVSGLREFRDYLSLIQLSDELNKSDSDLIVVDTPPLEEAVGLHRSVKNLRTFFGTYLVQIALQSTRFSLVQISFKKAFEMSRFFIGKRAAETVLELIEWLTQHRERFETASHFLEQIFNSRESNHIFVLTPESPESLLAEIKTNFKETQNISFYLNQSVFEFRMEMPEAYERETKLISKIKKAFPKSQIQLIPLQIMGDDTEEEMTRFLRSKAIRV